MKKIYFILPLIYVFLPLNLKAQTNFVYQNPFPTGNDLTNITHTENIVYASGWNNSLIKSTNSGENWLSISTPLNVPTISDIFFFNKDTGYFCGDGLYRTSNQGNNWEKISNYSFDRFTFVDRNVGYGIYDDFSIYKTTNSGYNWFQIGIPGTSSIRDLCFINSTGFISRDNNIYRTTNGGESWDTVQIGNTGLAYYFINSQIGYAACGNSTCKILKTTNSGSTWLELGNVGTNNPIKIRFTNEDIGYCIFINKFYKTTNGGVTWVNIDVSDMLEVNFDIINDTTMIVVGTGGDIFKTTNSGLNWQNKKIDFINGSINCMKFINLTTGYFAGNNGVFYITSDAGQNWSNLNYRLNNNFFSMETKDNNIFLGSDIGRIFKTSNNGFTWDTLKLPEPVNVGFIKIFGQKITVVSYATYYNQYYNITCYRSNNEGTNWTILDYIIDPALVDVSMPDENTLYVSTEYTKPAGRRAILWKSTDGGENFINKYFNYSVVFTNIQFFDANEGLIFRDDYGNDKILKTLDGGSNWSVIYSSNQDLPAYMNFKNRNIGYLTNSSWGAKTTNGGLNWQSFNVGTQYGDKSYFIDYNTGFLFGNTTLVRTINGGGVFTGVNITHNPIPSVFTLYQNYPNPFNPSTKINFDIPRQTFVTLKIYDIAGREIAKLANGEYTPGAYSVVFDAAKFASGVYFYRITAGDFVETKRMVLIK